MTRFVIVLCVLLAVVAAAPKKKKPSSSDGKIIGGKDTDISQVPYQVSLQFKKKHWCGGSLITPKHVLTAAHCIQKGDDSDYTIRVGSTYHDEGGDVIKVTKIRPHPMYDYEIVNYDVAVLELKEPVKNPKAKPISIADNEPKPGDEALVSGWGMIKEGTSAHKNLQSITVPVVSRQSCQKAFFEFSLITGNMWCAGYSSGGKDACQGDSGGPAVINGRQAGIVSWGDGCGKKNTFGVYTNIPVMKEWIEAQTKSSRKGNH